MPPFKALVKNRVVEWRNAQINTHTRSVQTFNPQQAHEQITCVSVFSSLKRLPAVVARIAKNT